MSKSEKRMCIGGPLDGKWYTSDDAMGSFDHRATVLSEEATSAPMLEDIRRIASQVHATEKVSRYNIVKLAESDGTWVAVWLHESVSPGEIFRHILKNYRPKAEASG